MKQYEGMFILKSDLDKAGIDKVLTHIKDVITKEKGLVDEMREWGKAKLSYPIKKYKEGLYCLATFNITGEGISKIKKSFLLNDLILRVLITAK